MQAKVWNDNEHVFTDDSFKGEKITIPPKSFIEMEYGEANEFKYKYSPIKVGGDNQQLPSSYKMIRVEPIGEPEAVKVAGVNCQACGKTYESQKVLDAHIDEQHLEAMADKTVAEKRRFKPVK